MCLIITYNACYLEVFNKEYINTILDVTVTSAGIMWILYKKISDEGHGTGVC